MMDFDTLKRISEDLGIGNARKLYIENELWKNTIQENYSIPNLSYMYPKLGEHIMADGKECVVVSLYPNRLPSWVMLPKEFGKKLVWEIAMNVKLPDGWKIPSKEEFSEFGKNIAKLQKSGNREFSCKSIGDYLWSSTDYDASYAWCLNTYYSCLDKNERDYSYSFIHTRSFKKLEELL